MSSKTIFITIPWFVPAFKAGGPIQSIVNMVAELNEGYQFFIFTSNTDLHGLPIAVAHTDQWVDYNEYTKVWYAGRYNRSQQLVDQVKQINPDTLYMIGLFDWHFTIVPLLFTKAPKKILSVRGMLHPGALSQKRLKKQCFLQAMKWMGVEKKTFFQASDAQEAQFIKNIFPKAEQYVVGNFPRLLTKQSIAPKIKDELKMVSVGIISPMKNYALVLEALQGIKAKVHYTIYGPVKDTAYWEACLQTIQALPANIEVDYQKELPPHKVPSKLEGNHVFVLPSKSENFGHAIAEALSAGMPVLSSNAVPWLGLAEALAGANVEPTVMGIRNVLESFAAMDNETYEKYTEGAYRYIRKTVDLEKLKAGYREML